MKEIKYYILLVLFVIALVNSIILSIPENNCPDNTCSIVQNSGYEEFLGIKNSYYGILIFSFMIIITISYIRKPNKLKHFLIHTGILIGALISVYLIYLQTMVINKYCQNCLMIDFSMLIALLITIIRKKKFKR